MKKIVIFTFLIAFLFSACKKEDCNCQKLLGTFNFGIRTSHYPINSTVIPHYKIANDTTELPLYISYRFSIDEPPKSLGLDYYRYETDNTEFRNSDFGLFYYSVSGSYPDQTPDKLFIDWFGVKDLNTIYQKYSMDLLIPVDSNEFNNQIFIYDSLQVTDKWYKKVLTGPVYKSYQPGLEYSDAIPERYYYSTEYGIIKFDMSDGTVWEMLSLE